MDNMWVSVYIQFFFYIIEKLIMNLNTYNNWQKRNMNLTFIHSSYIEQKVKFGQFVCVAFLKISF